MGIGSLSAVGAGEARERAAAIRKQVRGGGDPSRSSRPSRPRPRRSAPRSGRRRTGSSASSGSRKFIRRPRATPTGAHDEAVARLGSKVIDQIEVPDVVRLVVPKFEATWDGGHRLRAYIERVIAHAKTHGRADTNLRNPALSDLIAPALAHLKKPKRKHHASMPFEQVPEADGQARRDDQPARARSRNDDPVAACAPPRSGGPSGPSST